jgi:23S rRNA pseudouridine2605 synthase
MTDQNEHDDAADAHASGDAPTRRPGERLAKAIARAGLGSRRDAEVWIGEGRVKVNGSVVDAAAFNVVATDHIEVDGRPLPQRERTRMWLYHKPRGYVTTNRDPEGRETVFEILPAGLPRVMTVGRLDINTEGLLLLTNDGGLARVLELPETGWLRRYRVRAFGRVTQDKLEALKEGLTIDGFSYGPIEAEVERQQNDNVWLMIGLREGKNREVKRVAEHLGLAVNRLIRISFGPFQLGNLGEGEAEEVRSRTLADQLGKRLTEEAGLDFDSDVIRAEDAPRVTGGRGGKTAPREDRERLTDASKRVGRRAPVVRPRDVPAPETSAPVEKKEPATRVKRGAPVADRQGRKVAVERISRTAGDEAPKRVSKRDPAAAERFGAAGRPERPKRPGAKPPARGDRPDRAPRREGAEGERRGPPRERGDRPQRAPSGDRPLTGRVQRSDTSNRPARGPRPEGAGRPGRDGDRPNRPSFGERPPRGDRPERPSFGDRPRPERGDRPQRAPSGDRPARGPRPERSSFGDRPARPERSDAPRSEAPRPESSRPAPRWREDAPGAARERPFRPAGDRPQRDRPTGDRPQRDRSERPTGGRPEGGRPPRREGGERPGGGAGGRPPRGDRPSGAGRPGGDRPAGAGRPGGDRPAGAGRPGNKPGGFKPGGPKGGGRPTGGGRPSGGGGKPGGGGRPAGGGKGRPGGGADRRR